MPNFNFSYISEALLKTYGCKSEFLNKIQRKISSTKLMNIRPGVHAVDIIRSQMDGWARPTYNVFFNFVENA
jgi:hypothetical protein